MQRMLRLPSWALDPSAGAVALNLTLVMYTFGNIVSIQHPLTAIMSAIINVPIIIIFR